ncbi:30S ribosomal protein S2 [Tautonia plasticadhaerens]|uniref:Small ribosomal subunit protein uS2 n=1 Tax=Tautonia plasticadhaerens TaxID=2527974 RepID=A0A518H751_9BACT|nr:30S ribosomal protein S2 [Tautonia plasticadhaerens]QDV36634.1 30S ribosomal protein S2 [Tautonia plasticadhaerens]
MAIAVKDLIEAGVHYGHRASRWNPKMKPYIYGKRNLIHIIDLKETVRGLLRAVKYFNRVASGGGLILFVGTKRQAVDIVVEHAQQCGMPFVTERWLGGTLTNFQTIRSRLDRLDELEQTLGSDMALTYSKKALSTLNRERRKISRNLEGIRHMTRKPEAMFVIDPHREKIAVSEARKLGVKVVALMDTDCDPDVVDLPIPGNDDSMRAIELILGRLTQAIIDGKAAAPPEAQRPEPGPGGPRGRGDRRGPAGPGGLAGRGGSAPAGAAGPASDPATQAGGGQSPPVAPPEPGDSAPRPLPAEGPLPEGVQATAPISQPSAGPEPDTGDSAPTPPAEAEPSAAEEQPKPAEG